MHWQGRGNQLIAPTLSFSTHPCSLSSASFEAAVLSPFLAIASSRVPSWLKGLIPPLYLPGGRPTAKLGYLERGKGSYSNDRRLLQLAKGDTCSLEAEATTLAPSPSSSRVILKLVRFVVLLKARYSNRCEAPVVSGVSYALPESTKMPTVAVGPCGRHSPVFRHASVENSHSDLTLL